jgi:hypothetical protein
MTIRGMLALLYCVALTLGVWWILQRNDLAAMDFVAKRDLSLNRQLQSGDVEAASWNRLKSLVGAPGADEFVGRYLRGPLPKGAALRKEATDTVPNLTVMPGRLALLSSMLRSMAWMSSVRRPACDVGRDSPRCFLLITPATQTRAGGARRQLAVVCDHPLHDIVDLTTVDPAFTVRILADCTPLSIGHDAE